MKYKKSRKGILTVGFEGVDCWHFELVLKVLTVGTLNWNDRLALCLSCFVVGWIYVWRWEERQFYMWEIIS